MTPADLDPLLTAYFHAQRPAAWPPAPPGARVPTPPTHRPAGRARLTLAVSVGVLFGGLLLASGARQPSPARPDTPTPGVLAGSTADAAKVRADVTKAKPR